MKVDQLEKTLDNIRAWILSVDQKTNTVLVLELALITLIAKPTYDIAASKFNELTNINIILLSATVVLFGFSLIKLLLVIMPKVDAKDIDSLIFFGFIAKKTAKAYLKAINKSSKKSYRQDLISQIHTTSLISSYKHLNYKDGVVSLPVALLAWVLYSVSIWIGL